MGLAGSLLIAACSGPDEAPATPTPVHITRDAAALERPNADLTSKHAADICTGLPLPASFVPGAIPAYEPGDAHSALVEAARERYRTLGLDYRAGVADYSPEGDFLNYGRNSRYEADPSLRWDENGIPMVEYDGAFYYNPVTVAQYALTLHGRYLRGESGPDQFLDVASFLLTRQDDRGAFPAAYPYTYYLTGEVFKPGWVSGMSQGQALSVFRRAYAVSGDERYLAAGDTALAHLATSRAAGGPMETLYYLDPALDDFITFEEFATETPFYTLNGFLFTLLGVYDWSTLGSESAGSPAAGLAGSLFECGLATAIYTLPYYDVDGFSAYDLGHVLTDGPANVQAEYHAIHIELLHALNSIRPMPELQRWLDEWARDVSPGAARER
jgi:hypothetical protein